MPRIPDIQPYYDMQIVIEGVGVVKVLDLPGEEAAFLQGYYGGRRCESAGLFPVAEHMFRLGQNKVIPIPVAKTTLDTHRAVIKSPELPRPNK